MLKLLTNMRISFSKTAILHSAIFYTYTVFSSLNFLDIVIDILYLIPSVEFSKFKFGLCR